MTTESTPPPEASEAPDFQLFDPEAVAIGTFLGGPLCGVLLISINHHRLGQEDRAKKVFWIGLALSILYFIVVFSLPDSATNTIQAAYIGFVFGFRAWAKQLFDSELEQHTQSGGTTGLRWWAALGGLTITGLILGIAGGIFAIVEAVTAPSCFTAEQGDEMVCYHSPKTEQDAQCIYDHLLELVYFDGTGSGYISLQDGARGQVVLKAHTSPEGWESPDLDWGFEYMRSSVGDACFSGQEIELHLINDLSESQLVFPNPSTPPCIDKPPLSESVCFRPPVTKEHAECLFDHLVSEEVFGGPDWWQWSLTANKPNTQLAIKFSVQPGIWNDTDTTGFLDTIRAQVQEACFEGKATVFHLLDDQGVSHGTLPQ